MEESQKWLLKPTARAYSGPTQTKTDNGRGKTAFANLAGQLLPLLQDEVRHEAGKRNVYRWTS